MQTSPLRTRRTPLQRAIADLLQMVAQVLLLFVIVSALVGRFEIHQHSMDPTFHEGQRVIVSRLGSLWSNMFVSTAHASERRTAPPFGLQRGQIAVFYESVDQTGDPLIKRVIGVPGDTIELREGMVWVNGAPLNELYLNGLTTECSTYCGPLTLEADSYFMMGDNRPVSRDSRSFGPVHASQIVGRVVMRYWPLDQLATYP